MSTSLSTWVVLADATHAKIYEHQDRKHFKLHHELTHPKGSAHIHDLVTDHQGHSGSGTRGVTFTQGHSPKDNEDTHFVMEIAHYLEHSRTTNQFKELIIVAPSHFYGLMEKHLGEQLKKKVTRHIMKDYLHLPEHELLKVVFPGQEI